MPDTDLINCVIVDDEPLAVKLLKDYVEKTPGLHCICATIHVMDALEIVLQGECTLLFLDIQMPELTGLQFMKIIRKSCNIVITSAHPQYAIEGYEHDVVDYLLKPVTFERYLTAVNKVKGKIAGSAGNSQVQTAIPDHIFIKTGNRLQRVDLDDILYIEGLRDYIAVHTKTAKILSLESMKNMLSLLPPIHFTRIHKSYIVNKNKITFLEKGGVTINKQNLPIGDTFRDAFLASIRKL
jgi:DNA-binding LytR/AlgR family response regulator